MAFSKNYPALVKDENVNIGNGWLFLGPANTAYDDDLLQNAGCLTGSAELTPVKTTATLLAGSPQMPIREEITELGFTLKVTLVELSVRTLQKYLGYGTRTAHVTSTPTVTDETITLYDNGFYVPLQGLDITTASVTVESTDATPVEYTETTDYVVDYTNGLIKSTGVGISNGETVHVTYTWSRPAYEKISIGSEPVLNWYALKFVVPHNDGTRSAFKMWKAVPSELPSIPFQPDDFTKFDVTFKAQADRTKTPDQMLCAWEMETLTPDE